MLLRYGWLGMFVLLAACSTSRYQHEQDFIPRPILNPDALQDAEVKAEPRSVLGNPARYEVLGKEYQVMSQAAGFKQQGYASWYGMKFHGHATSNGETYDVYKMTAAHKTLPLPSYVRVTRKDNGASVVVRVNDRGPFHEGRIIDLSYAAAVKLGIDKAGTAEVELETLSVPTEQSQRWLQVSAFSNPDSALKLQQQLSQLQPWPVNISQRKGSQLHKVRIGPVPDGEAMIALVELLRQNQLPEPVLLAQHQL